MHAFRESLKPERSLAQRLKNRPVDCEVGSLNVGSTKFLNSVARNADEKSRRDERSKLARGDGTSRKMNTFSPTGERNIEAGVHQHGNPGNRHGLFDQTNQFSGGQFLCTDLNHVRVHVRGLLNRYQPICDAIQFDHLADHLAELKENGFCVLKACLGPDLIERCREAFWPTLAHYIQRNEPNRGPHRYCLPMPFEPPCFSSQFFFNAQVLDVVRGAMDDRVVADQWSCDVPLQGSEYQAVHVDYQRPLFAEAPDLLLPIYMLVVSFGLSHITADDGPLEIASGTHRVPRDEALRLVESTKINMRAVPLDIGDVLIRHPWAWHRGTPNRTDVPRSLVSIRYVRRVVYRREPRGQRHPERGVAVADDRAAKHNALSQGGLKIMICSDLGLSRRLERAEGRACVNFAKARRQLFPASGSEWMEFAGAYVVFDGVESPVTQTFGLGLFEELSVASLDVIERFFMDRGAPVQHEVSPMAGVPAHDLLCARGYRPIELSNVLYRLVDTPEVPTAGKIRVRVTGPDESALWNSVSTKGWAKEYPEFKSFLAEISEISAVRDQSLCFLAEFDGQPGAAGAMCIDEGIALFAGAATIPEMRHRGLQSALLEERIRCAFDHGCDLALMVAAAGSSSQRNAERKGFRVAYTRTKWRLHRSP